MPRRRTRSTWANPLYEDLFDRESVRPGSLASSGGVSSSTEEATVMAQPNHIGERRLCDDERPQNNRAITRVNAPLGPGIRFDIDPRTLSLLPTYYGLPSENPYRYIEEFSQTCKFF